MEVRVAPTRDAAAIALLRSLWSGSDEPGFVQRVADWIESEGDHRTTWLATADGAPAGMASLFEYRRMPRPGHPDSHWGYIGNMFVREDLRGRGIGSALLAALVETSDERGYVRLVLSPTERAVPFYRRAGFVVPDDAAGDDRLLVRPKGVRPPNPTKGVRSPNPTNRAGDPHPLWGTRHH